MPRPGRLSARPSNVAGFGPWPSKDGVTTRHARFIHEPEENRLSRSPGDFTRVSPNHPGTGPTSPATQTGVSVMGREEVWHGF
jgi:hypothetical protein